MELTLLDESFKELEIVEIFNSLIWTDRYYEAGDFQIVTSPKAKMVRSLAMGRYLTMKDSEHVMEIEDIWIHTTGQNGNKVFIKGRSLEAVLDRRCVWDQTVLTGSFQDAIEFLLNKNAIDPVIAARKIPNLSFEASEETVITDLTVDTQIRGVSLYKAILDLCVSKGIGFKITRTSAGAWVFKLYAGIDRSSLQTENPYVTFSPKYENLVNSEYKESTTTLKTVTLVAGEGEGASRDTLIVPSPSGDGEGLARRELFTDAGDISRNGPDGTLTEEEYSAQLTQRGLEDLALHPYTRSFEGQIEASGNFVYGKDFGMGDIVEVANEYGFHSESRVIELIHSEDSAGIKIYPTFSTIS